MRLGLSVMAALVLAGCGAASELGADTEDFIDQDTPPGNCSAGTSAEPCPNADSTGTPVGGPCIDSDDCAPGTSCVAPYQGGEVGDFTCTDECLPLEDESAWCYDAAACCADGAICRRGLCVLPEPGETGGTDESTGTAGGATDDSGSAGDTEATTGSTTSGTGTTGDTGAGSSTTGMP